MLPQIFALVQDELYAVERLEAELLDELYTKACRLLSSKEPPQDSLLSVLEAVGSLGLDDSQGAENALQVSHLARLYADERRAASVAIASANEATATSRTTLALNLFDRALARRDLAAASHALSPLLRAPEVRAALAAARRETGDGTEGIEESAGAGTTPNASGASDLPPDAGARLVLAARSRLVDLLVKALLEASGLHAKEASEPLNVVSSSRTPPSSGNGSLPVGDDSGSGAASQSPVLSPNQILVLLQQLMATGQALDVLCGATLGDLLPLLHDGDASGSFLERGTLKVLKGLREGVFGDCPELAASFGRLLWPQYAKEYLSTRLSLPADAASFGPWEHAADRGARLERRVATLGFLHAPPLVADERSEPGPIERGGSALAARFLHGWRDSFIGRVRESLAAVDARDAVEVELDALVGQRVDGPKGAAKVAQGVAPRGPVVDKAPEEVSGRSDGWDDAWEEDEEGWDSGTPQPSSAPEASDELPESRTLLVSRGVQSLVLVIKDLMHEACASGSASLAREACGCVVNAAAMTSELQWWLPGESRPPPDVPGETGGGARPPRATRPPPEAPPYAAALWRNDCALVHDVLRALPSSLAPSLQDLVHRSVGFVNPAARVAHSGALALDAAEGSARAEVAGALEDLCAFSGLDDGRGLLRCRRAVQRCLLALRRIRASVGPVLPAHAYVTVVGELAQFAASRTVVEIMSLGDIAVDECEAIPTIARDLVEGVLEATTQGFDAAFRRAVEREAPALSKLRAIADVLEMRLLDIKRRWASGNLAAAGLQAGELAHLVRAVFQPSPLRSSVLDDLER